MDATWLKSQTANVWHRVPLPISRLSPQGLKPTKKLQRHKGFVCIRLYLTREKPWQLLRLFSPWPFTAQCYKSQSLTSDHLRAARASSLLYYLLIKRGLFCVAKTAWCLHCVRIQYNTYEQYQYMVKDQAWMQEEWLGYDRMSYTHKLGWDCATRWDTQMSR